MRLEGSGLVMPETRYALVETARIEAPEEARSIACRRGRCYLSPMSDDRPRRTFALGFTLCLAGLLAACGPSHTGTFVDPSGTTSVTIKSGGKIVGGMDQKMTYVVVSKGEQGTTLAVENDPPDSWSAEWTVTKDGKELHGASSPAKVVSKRR